MKLILEFLQAMWANPCLGFALFLLLSGFSINLYTDSTISGDCIVKVSAIYIYVYINFISCFAAKFKKDYPYLYWVLTLVCLILTFFSAKDILVMYNRLVELCNGIVKMLNGWPNSGSGSQGGGNNGYGSGSNLTGGGPSGPGGGPGGPGGPNPGSGGPDPMIGVPPQTEREKKEEAREKARLHDMDKADNKQSTRQIYESEINKGDHLTVKNEQYPYIHRDDNNVLCVPGETPVEYADAIVRGK